MSKKKIIRIIIFSILGLILAVAVFLGIRYRNTLKLVFNWDNIVAFVNSQRYSSDEIEEKMEDNKKQLETLAKKDPNINVRGDLSAEEAKALKDGLITYEEAISIVKGDTTLEEILASKENKEEPQEEKEPDEKPEDEKKPEEKPQEPKPEPDRVSEIIAEFYVIQADFISRLEAMGDRAYEDYKAQNYDRSKVMDIVNSYTGEVGILEAECDAKVRTLLKELETELTAKGGDLGIIKEIRQYYYNEKSLKKTYYLNRLNDEDYK